VDECERDAALAHAVNVEGPRHLAEAAASAKADLVHFSTNYVFEARSRKKCFSFAPRGSMVRAAPPS
jgi:dTDP-4-dehydrorhamnose reductase